MDALTPKMKALLDYFAFEVGRYEPRTLGLGDAMTATALRKRGLMNSSPGGRNGKQLDWWISEKGYEVAGESR